MNYKTIALAFTLMQAVVVLLAAVEITAVRGDTVVNISAAIARVILGIMSLGSFAFILAEVIL